MSGPRISDHALVRFLERAGGLDVQGVRGHLSASLARAAGAARRLGLVEYTVQADGLSYRIVDDVVVTIIDETARGRR